MKRIQFYLIALAGVLVTGCYDDYMVDYDYDAIYTAYQYDLRTFVLGEKQGFDFTVGLGGLDHNDRDRKVSVSLDNSLLTADLSTFSSSDAGVESFTAIDAFMGNPGLGYVSQGYVTEEVKNAGITGFEPLPEAFYKIDGLNSLTIEKGRHTAYATITANDAITSDPKTLKPYYALGFKINSADADKMIPEMSFEIIAVKVENKHFGYWYYEGVKTIVSDNGGSVISSTTYKADLNQADALSCYLTTKDFNVLSANKVGGEEGEILLTIAPDKTITVSSPEGGPVIQPVAGSPSFTNDALLLQDREIHLNYSYSNGDGTSTVVADVLRFKYRIRDGVLEYQDENPDHYEKK